MAVPWISMAGAVSGTSLTGIELPARMRSDAGPLELIVCGVRDSLWIEHYVAGLYVSVGASTQAAADTRRAKGVRLHVLESAYLPTDIPDKWRKALKEVIDEEPLARIGAAYRKISTGDVLRIVYDPQSAVTITLNSELVAYVPGHRVVDSILSTWAEHQPVGEKLARLAIEHPCGSAAR